MNARTVNLSHLASQCSGSAQVSSSYRRLQHFFQYVTLEGDWLALAVVKLLKLRAPWVLYQPTQVMTPWPNFVG